MKKTILFLLVCVSINAISFTESAETLKFTKLEKFNLSQTQLKVLKKSNLSIYQIKGEYAYPGKGYIFYAAKTPRGGLLIKVLNSSSKTNPENVIVPINELPFEVTGIGTVMEYCSCGSNIIDSDGDACHQYQVSANNFGCGGGCTGDNQGRSCSFTQFDTDTGQITNHI